MVLITIKQDRRTEIIDSEKGTLEASVCYPDGFRKEVLIENLDSERIKDYLGYRLGEMLRDQVMYDYGSEGNCFIRKTAEGKLVLSVRIED